MIRHKKKVVFLTTGAIALVAIAIIIALLLSIQAFTPQIETAASAALGMDVRIKGRMGVALYPGFGLSLKNVDVRNSGLDVVTIEKMRIVLKLLPLAKFKIKIIQVEFVRPIFSIVRSQNGMFNFEKPGRSSKGKFLAMKLISVSQGGLVYIDEISREKIEVDNLDLSVKNLLYSGADGAETFNNISFSGDIRARTLTINNFCLTNLEIRATAGNGILEINPVRFDIFGGTGKGSLHADVTGASPHFRVVTTLDHFRIEELIHAASPGNIPQKSIEGTVNFSADLTATGKSTVEAKQSLNGDLSLNGENLMLYNINIDALITKYERSQNMNLVDVAAVFLAGPFGPVLTKSYNLGRLYEESQGGKGIIRKLVSVWKVKNGIAEARDVALAAKKQRIAMTGGLNFINERFVDVTIAALDKQGCVVYSEKVHGPFRKPQIEKESAFRSIAGSLLNPLGDAWEFLQGKECTVFYSGSVAQPEG
jgi:uncharacterized protein involved in outer membrane biogenesis